MIAVAQQRRGIGAWSESMARSEESDFKSVFNTAYRVTAILSVSFQCFFRPWSARTKAIAVVKANRAIFIYKAQFIEFLCRKDRVRQYDLAAVLWCFCHEYSLVLPTKEINDIDRPLADRVDRPVW